MRGFRFKQSKSAGKSIKLSTSVFLIKGKERSVVSSQARHAYFILSHFALFKRALFSIIHYA